MSRIIWDAVGDRTFEGGLDRGVLYVNGFGFAWNGLISIEEQTQDENPMPVYIDGMKVREVERIGDFSGVLTAYTYPDEFLPCEGVILMDGVYVDNQTPVPFGLSYRTKVGNDVQGLDQGYLIHIVYGLTAIPNTTSYSTLSLSPAPLEFSWSLAAVPQKASSYRPTAHIFFDTRLLDPEILFEIEDLLYGNEFMVPTIPPIEFFIDWLAGT